MKANFIFEHRRNGELLETIEEVAEAPEIVTRPATDLGNMADKQSVRASACIYCGKNTTLSREHVIPFAWNGPLLIWDGSCEDCRLLTSRFESDALNDGTMAEVRQALDMQSRSGHSSAREKLAVSLTVDGETQVASMPASELPKLLGLPLFSLPALLEGSARDTLGLAGWTLACFGPDPNAFLAGLGATTFTFQEDRKRAVAFAQTMAKIAYGYAWIDGIFEVLPDGGALVQAFLREPDTLGRYVGTRPAPFVKSPGHDFLLRYGIDATNLRVTLDVQPFANIGAPTYVVVLGRCSTLRQWRDIRRRIQGGFRRSRATRHE